MFISWKEHIILQNYSYDSDWLFSATKDLLYEFSFYTYIILPNSNSAFVIKKFCHFKLLPVNDVDTNP